MLRRELISAVSLVLISSIIMILIPFQVESVNVTQRTGYLISVTPRTFPTFLTLVMFVLSIGNLGIVLKNKRANKYEGQTAPKMDLRSILIAFIVLIVYSLIVETVGYLISTILLLLFLLKFFEAKLWQIAVIGLFLPPILFYAFRYLYVPLPKGFLG